MVIENIDLKDEKLRALRTGDSRSKTSFTAFCNDQAIAGAVGGCATRFFCQPFDVLKIRFQIQIEPVDGKSKTSVYTGVSQGIRHIVNNEGWTALWKGHTAAQALSISFGFIQFGLFESLTKYAFQSLPELEMAKPGVNFCAGLVAGCGATIISFPFDTIRTRLVIQGEPKVYRNMIDVWIKMWKQEGARSLYRGFWPTLLAIGPYAGFQFASYKLLVDLYEKHFGEESPGMRSLSCGAVAGAIAKTIVYPLDLGKKRLQTQGFSDRHQYKGLKDCLKTTVRNEGMSALLKGLSPSLLKAFFSSALHFYFYELVLRILSR